MRLVLAAYDLQGLDELGLLPLGGVAHHPYMWSNPNQALEDASNWALMLKDMTYSDGTSLKSLRTQMVELGIVPSEWGGTYEFVDVSAKAGTNLDGLLETILLVADLDIAVADDLQWNAHRGHLRLIVENAPKVIAIRKDLGLQRQECAA